MKWLIAVAAALMTVTAQAKVLECRLPSSKDPLVDRETMRIELNGDSISVHHTFDYPALTVKHDGPRKVLYHHYSDYAGLGVSVVALEDIMVNGEGFPELITVAWATGSLRTTTPGADAWQTGWSCMRLD